MRVYFKILTITGGIQILGFTLGMLSDTYLPVGFLDNLCPLFFFISSLVVSSVLGIWLPIRWGATKKQKISMIFLLPTNYSLVICVALYITVIYAILQSLTELGEAHP